MTRVFIIDDEPAAIALLKALLTTHWQVQVVGQGNDVTPEVGEQLVAVRPDLLFLDVELPSGTGLDFWSRIHQQLPPGTRVVFYTAWDKYMLDALRRQAFDYLLKPATLPELQKVMTHYLEQRLEELSSKSASAAQPSSKVLVVTAVGDRMAISSDEIAFFRYNTDRKLWEVVTSGGTTVLLRHRTTADVITAYSPAFVQIHKRYIVNTAKIATIQDQLCLLSPPLDKCRELQVSKNYRRQLLDTFYNM